MGDLQPRPAAASAALDVAPLYRYNSAPHLQPRRGGVALSAQQIARNPGYARLPASQSVFFGARGSQSFEGFHLVDLAATYSVPVWQSLAPWVKVEVLNALNNQKLISWNTTDHGRHGRSEGRERAAAELHQGPAFGTATGTASYPRPRPGMDGGRTLHARGRHPVLTFESSKRTRGTG